jgi:hypothetical protein
MKRLIIFLILILAFNSPALAQGSSSEANNISNFPKSQSSGEMIRFLKKNQLQ